MIYINLEGRIGNNLWQVAAAATLAERLGEDFVAVPNPYYHCPEPDNCSFTDYIKPYKKTIFRNVRFEDTFPADCYQYEVEMDLKSIQSLPAKNVRLEGYFQNIHYVSERVIQHLFIPSCVEMITKLRAKYPMLDKKNTCAIVVRRGLFAVAFEISCGGYGILPQVYADNEKTPTYKRYTLFGDKR